MKVPANYVGKVVGIHLARPVYVFEYGAHARVGGEERALPVPLQMGRTIVDDDGQKQTKVEPATTDMLMGAVVREITDDAIEVDLFVAHRGPEGQELPRGAVMRKRIPSSLIMSIDTVSDHDAEMPVSRRRAASSIVMP